MSDKPKLLRVPIELHTVAELLGTASLIENTCAIYLGQNADGSLTFLTAGLSTAEANFMTDQCKMILMGPAPDFIGEVK